MNCKEIVAALCLILAVTLTTASPKYLWCRNKCKYGDLNVRWPGHGTQYFQDKGDPEQDLSQGGDREREFDQRDERRGSEHEGEEDFAQQHEREHDFERRSERERRSVSRFNRRRDFTHTDETEQDFENPNEEDHEFENTGETRRDQDRWSEWEQNLEHRPRGDGQRGVEQLIPGQEGERDKEHGKVHCSEEGCAGEEGPASSQQQEQCDSQCRRCYNSCSVAFGVCSGACRTARPIGDEWEGPGCFTTCFDELFYQQQTLSSF